MKNDSLGKWLQWRLLNDHMIWLIAEVYQVLLFLWFVEIKDVLELKQNKKNDSRLCQTFQRLVEAFIDTFLESLCCACVSIPNFIALVFVLHATSPLEFTHTPVAFSAKHIQTKKVDFCEKQKIDNQIFSSMCYKNDIISISYYFPRMLTTSSSSTRRKDNFHSSNSMASKLETQRPSSRNSHRDLRKTLTLVWPRSRRTFLMPWSPWSRTIWLLSFCLGEPRIPERWLMDIRSTSSSLWVAKFQMLFWVSSSDSTMVIG